MQEEVKALAMLWVLREERTGDVTTLSAAWEANRLDELPPSLAYLLLECGVFFGFPLTHQLFAGALERLGVQLERASARALTPEQTLMAAKTLIATLRRREKLLVTWKERQYPVTNRLNRMAHRAHRLWLQEVRDNVRRAAS